MPVQRKIFRIEEHARSRALQSVARGDADGAERHREFMAELHALRQLIVPQAGADRDALERARAQIAEAQSYKHELELIYAAIARTRSEMAATDVAPGDSTARACRELTAIVAGTERATQSILEAAEAIDRAASALSAWVKDEQGQGLANDIQDRVVQIFEACNFQDLTGQRVAKVLETLTFIEEHMARVLAIWQGVERFKPVVLDGQDGDRRFLNGPKLPGDPGHSNQDDIDALFGAV